MCAFFFFYFTPFRHFKPLSGCNTPGSLKQFNTYPAIPIPKSTSGGMHMKMDMGMDMGMGMGMDMGMDEGMEMRNTGNFLHIKFYVFNKVIADR